MKYIREVSTAAAVLMITGSLSCGSASAEGLLGSVGGLLGGAGSGAGTTSPAELSSGLAGLSTSFALSFQNMLKAEALSARAFGLKADADDLEHKADYYAKGSVEDYDQVERDVKVSSDAQAKIDEKMAQSKALDASAKAQLSQAAPYYAVGTVHAVALPGQYAAWVSRAQASVGSIRSNPVSMASNAGLVTQVPKVAQLTAQLPDLTQKWLSVTRGFLSFTHKQKIDTGDLSSKVLIPGQAAHLFRDDVAPPFRLIVAQRSD
jgi:hypothetical protein